MAVRSDYLVDTFLRSIDAAQCIEKPYRHWLLSQCLPDDILRQLLNLPFAKPAMSTWTGKRDGNNSTRQYFNVAGRERHGICDMFCRAFQDVRVTDKMAVCFDAKLGGTFLRAEYAQDADGFWLEPHTDLGVKALTLLLYLSNDDHHRSLGTDIYDTDRRPVGRAPFVSNSAMVFVPSDMTFHGFERRPIVGIRKSVIVNFVSAEWQARDQLAFPHIAVK
jgi:hypothetical protein